jgi:hypothetical protein
MSRRSFFAFPAGRFLMGFVRNDSAAIPLD